MKKILLSLALLIGGLVFAILVCEGLLRVLTSTHLISVDKNLSFAKDPFVYSSTLKYTIKPYLIRDCTAKGNPKAICYANDLGFRDIDHTFLKPKDVYRIVLIGDSLTYGPGINFDGTYPAIFSDIIKKNNLNKKKIEIINLGMIFYGPQQYYYMYKEYGSKYKPDLVIMSYHLLTDPFDAYEYNQNRNFYFLKSIPDIIPYSISQPLKEHSYLFRLLLSAYYHLVNKQLVVPEDKYKNAYHIDTQLTVSSPDMRQGWQQTEEYVKKLIKAVHVDRAKIAIIIFPSRAQVDPGELKKIKERGMLSDTRLYSESATEREMTYLCKKNQWSCLDLQEPLRKVKNPQALFLNTDIHLTKAGNTVVANTAYQYLKQHNFF